MNVAIYLRLSVSDGDLDGDEKKESNSIENQRLMLTEFLAGRPELHGQVIEYADDGWSGMDFNRPAFQKMIEDAKSGLIQVIVAKDLSRLGRNYVEMGDYLDQVFPWLGVRVIAVGSNYDSNDHVGDVSGMDVAITNFINASYSRDLSVRRRSAYEALIKKGTPPSSRLPFGYRKNPAKKGEWLVDEKPAEIVRKIFGLAAEGHSVKEIVNALNDEKALLPGTRMEELYGYRNRTVTDGEYHWDSARVRSVLKNYEYAGACVVHKNERSAYVSGKYRAIPRDQWITIENHHVPLVDAQTYLWAQRAIRRVTVTDKGKPAFTALRSKLRCGTCHLAFRFFDNNGKFKCAHKGTAGRISECSCREHSYVLTEANVFTALKKHLENLTELDAIARRAVETITPGAEALRRRAGDRIRVLTAERVRQYEGYAQGLISREEYLERKEHLTEEITLLEKETLELERRQADDRKMIDGIQEAAVKARHALNSPFLTNYVVETFIKSVYLFECDRFEITYRTDDIVARTVQRSLEIMETVESGEKQEEGVCRYDSDQVKRLREINECMKAAGKRAVMTDGSKGGKV